MPLLRPSGFACPLDLPMSWLHRGMDLGSLHAAALLSGMKHSMPTKGMSNGNQGRRVIPFT